MSETTSTRGKPAVPEPENTTDSLGRVLTFQKLDALAELDLIEAAGTLAENRAWMLRATLACCVTAVDGVPMPAATNRERIRQAVKLVGAEGIAAIVATLSPAEQAASEADSAATAKN